MVTSTSKAVSSVPVEIWDMCWTRPCISEQSLHALSLTCSLFREICQPLLFRYMLLHCFVTDSFDNLDDETYGRWEAKVKSVQGKLQFFLDNPTFGRHPHLFTFSGMQKRDLRELAFAREESEALYGSVVDTLGSALGLLTGLRILLLQDVEIDDRVVQGLLKMKFLKDLRLQSTKFLKRTLEGGKLIAPETLSILNWDRESAEGEDEEEDVPKPMTVADREEENKPFELFSVSRLKTVEIHSPLHMKACLKHFTSQGPNERLTTLALSIEVTGIPTLFAFLEVCPQLETLTIAGAEHFHPTYPTLSPTALPRLTNFTGVASLGALLIPNRPLTKVVLHDSWGASHEEVPTSTLYAVKKSKAKITHLSLPFMPPHPEVFALITGMFPELETLEFRFHLVIEDALLFRQVYERLDEEELNVEGFEPPPIELDEDGEPARPTTSIKGLFDWLCLKKLPLPPRLRALSVLQHTPRVVTDSFHLLFLTFLSYNEQLAIAQRLGGHYPTLREMTFGRKHIQWNRKKRVRDVGVGPGRERVGGGGGAAAAMAAFAAITAITAAGGAEAYASAEPDAEAGAGAGANSTAEGASEEYIWEAVPDYKFFIQHRDELRAERQARRRAEEEEDEDGEDGNGNGEDETV